MIEVFKRCFSVNLNEYENINIDLEINKVITLTFAVFGVLVVFLNLYRGNMRLVTSQLLRHGAKNEETAKTLGEIGLGNLKMARFLLAGDTLLTKIVGRVGEKRCTYEEYKKLSKEERNDKIDFESAKFYVREGQTDRAKNISEKYSSSVVRTIVTCVLIGIVCICIIACMPGILNIINNLLETVKK